MDKLRHIHSKIGTETAYRIPVSAEGAIVEAVAAYDLLMRERDQLAVQCAELEGFIKKLADGGLSSNTFERQANARFVLKHSSSDPAYLLLHDARVMEKLSDNCVNAFGSNGECIEVFSKAGLRYEANELRSQAAAQKERVDV